MRMEFHVRKMWKNRVGRTRKHLQKFILPSGDGVDIASLWNDKKSESQNTIKMQSKRGTYILVLSTSSNGRTTSKKSDGGMKAASSSHNTSPPDPRNVLL